MWCRHRDHIAQFSETGTGKTYMMLQWLEEHDCHRVLLLEDPVYIDLMVEDIEHLSDFTAVAITGLKARRRRILQESTANIFVTNYETCRTIGSDLRAANFDAVIADESTIIKNSRTARSRAALKYLRHIPHRCISTGTPTTNKLFDLWAQFLFLDHGATLDTAFTRFRSRFFFPAGFDWRPKAGAPERLQQVIKRKTFNVRKADCLDLPPQVFKRIPVNMTQLKETFELEFDDGTVYETKYVLAQMAKLLQITSGAVLRPNGGIQRFPSGKPPMLKLLLRHLKDKHQGIVLWARHHFEIEDIVRCCRTTKMKGVVLTSKQDAAESVRIFQREPDCQAFIATLSKGARALTLTKASAVIYYSRDFSVDRRIQSENRTHRIGSERHAEIAYYDLVCKGTVDEKTLADTWKKRLLGKRLISGYTLKKILDEH
jgi:SNF2 family DNA or RNA helicase